MYRVGRERRGQMLYKVWWGELLELCQISEFADGSLLTDPFLQIESVQKNPSTSPDPDEKEG